MKILLADDDADVRMLVATILRLNGYQIDVVEDGEQALVAAGRKTYQLFLLDLNMPGRDGIDVCHSLRKELNYVDTPIVFLTGTTYADVGSCNSEFLIKPFMMDELIGKVSKLIN